MRRLFVCLVATVVTLPALAAMATEYQDNRDTFGSGTNSGNDGSFDFPGPWVEFADSGGGGHSSGWVRVGSDGVAAPGQPPGPSSGSGLRDAGIGLLADYQTGMMVDLDLQNVEVLGADLVVDFSLAVEIFEAARVWIAILVLMVTAAVVSGMDRRRRSGLSR
jgi:hypothetical protein